MNSLEYGPSGARPTRARASRALRVLRALRGECAGGQLRGGLAARGAARVGCTLQDLGAYERDSGCRVTTSHPLHA